MEASQRIKSLRLQIEDKIKSFNYPRSKRFFSHRHSSIEHREMHPRVAQYLRQNNWCYIHEYELGAGRIDFLAIQKTTGETAVIECKSYMSMVCEAIDQVKEYHKAIAIASAKKMIAVFELPKSPSARTYQSERRGFTEAQERLTIEGVELIQIPRYTAKLSECDWRIEFWLWYDYWHIGREDYREWSTNSQKWNAQDEYD